MPRIKKSYGIICCRPGPDGTQMLMVKKSTTYHFCEFVAGHYRKHNENHLTKLFNNMTYHEKMDILSLRFQTLWYRIYMENPDTVFIPGNKNIWASSYFKKKAKFESTFLQDGGGRLRRLINPTVNSDTPWEFPKGRKDYDREPSIETAIREFNEETGIEDHQFKMLWHLKPYVETYTDFGTTYQNTYYYAEAVGEWEPVYKFGEKKQCSEVSSVRWVSRTDLKHMRLETQTRARMLKSFKKIIRKYKNSHTKYVEHIERTKTYVDAIQYGKDVDLSKVKYINTGRG